MSAPCALCTGSWPRPASSASAGTSSAIPITRSRNCSRAFCQAFFGWYNTEHHHTGIGLLTPEVLHYGRAEAVIRQRQTVLSQAFERNPERFVRAQPKPPVLPTAVWINPPPVRAASEEDQH
jgi:putative transposase